MTTKEIAEAVGKDERSIQRWVKRLGDKVSSIGDKVSSSSPMRPADYTIDESVQIIEVGLGKNAASLFRENAGRSVPTVLEQMSDTRMDRLEAMMERLIGLVAVLVPPQVQARAALPAPNPLTLRAELNQVIRRGAKGDETGMRWSKLYYEFYYRNRINIKVKAENCGMQKLDFAEKKGLLPELLSLAYTLFPED